MQSSEIDRNNFTIKTHKRTTKQGGGIALIHNKDYRVEMNNKEDTDTYESCTWKVTIGTSTLSILGIYHPPDTNNYKFMDDITDKSISELSQHENLVIVGDLNIHWDDTDFNETSLLKDTIEALGLEQHVNEYTHKPENKTKIIEIRPTTSITVDRFSKHFNPNKILEAQSLSSAIVLFNNMVEHALDQIAPVKKVTLTRNVLSLGMTMILRHNIKS